ncbi:MAG TPA: response regulator transcription factor [Burkholderiales bacterium]|jgi:two-component system response regulator QseB
MRVLLVEDDTMVGESVHKGLRQEGFAVDWVEDGRAAELALDTGVYDLMLLDLGLPKKSGMDVLATLRQKKSALPVMLITARDAVADRVKGLDAGADDYLVKPFDLDELAARVRALVRRRAGNAENVLRHGALSLNPATHEAAFDGRALSLSGREFALLQALIERPGAVLSRTQLEDKLYGWAEEIGSNTVEVYIHALRKKIGTEFIKTVRGVGYTVPKQAA